jgi:SAM-dependent methyltransferase
MTKAAAGITSIAGLTRPLHGLGRSAGLEEFAVPGMSRFESAFCRGAGWRAFSSRIVLPWVLQGERLGGDLLEIGGGSGAMAARLLATLPGVRMTVIDYDEAMVNVSRARLAAFADRVTVRQADATELPFPDNRFDAVLSFIMLHHVINWEAALGEAVRVLRPGGVLVGYDLAATRIAHWLHQDEATRHRLATSDQLRDRLSELPVEAVKLRLGLAGLVVRFTAAKAPG